MPTTTPHLPSRHLPVILVLLAALAVVAVPAAAWTVGAGWARSDVGLDADGDGFYAAVGRTQPLGGGVFDWSYSLEYVQKKGSQPTWFADPVGGIVYDDAAVTLHVVQPGVFIGAHVPDLPVVPRLYTGLSVSLKVKESWSDFPGRPSQAYGYKESDIVAHVGASVGLGPVTVDVRYSQGLVGQLLDDNQDLPVYNPGKATDPLAGVQEAEIGAKIRTLQVGAAFAF